MNENDNIQYLYDNLKKNNYLTEGSIEDFRAYLEDEGNRQSLYDNLKKKNFLTEGSVDDFNAWLGIGQQPAPRVDVSDVEAAQKPSFEEWYKTVPADRNDTTSYNLRRAYDLAPMEELEAWRTSSAEDLQAGKNHLNSAYENPETGEYEFVKRKDHPTIQMELDWYNSNDPEAVEFRKRYSLDKSGDYYKYVPREEQPKQPAWMPNRMGGVGGEQNYMPQQTNYIERSKQEPKGETRRERKERERREASLVDLNNAYAATGEQPYEPPTELSGAGYNEVLQKKNALIAEQKKIEERGNIMLDTDIEPSWAEKDRNRAKIIEAELDKVLKYEYDYLRTPEGQAYLDRYDEMCDQMDAAIKEAGGDNYSWQGRLGEAFANTSPTDIKSLTPEEEQRQKDMAEYGNKLIKAKRDVKNVRREVRKTRERLNGDYSGFRRGWRATDVEGLSRINDFADTMTQLELAKKVREGKPLDKVDEVLLRANELKAASDMNLATSDTMWENIGSSAADQMVTTFEFVLGSAATGSTALAGNVSKNVMASMGRKAAKDAVVSEARNLLRAGTAELAGMAAGAGVQTFANPLSYLSMITDYAEKRTGTIYYDENDGQLHYFDNDKSIALSLWQAAAGAYIENFTEFSGEGLNKIGKVGLNKLYAAAPELKAATETISELLDKVKFSELSGLSAPAMDDFLRHAGFNGTLGEFGEEVLGNIIRPFAYVETEKGESYGKQLGRGLKNLVDADQNLETFLSCAITSAVLGTVGTVRRTASDMITNSQQKAYDEQLLKDVRDNIAKLDAMMNGVRGLDKEAFKEFVANNNVADISQYIKEQAKANNWTSDELGMVALYVTNVAQQNAMANQNSEAIQQSVDALNEQTKQLVNEWDGEHIYNVTFKDPKTNEELHGAVVNGRMHYTQNEDGTYKFNPYVSSAMLAIRMEDGSVRQVSSRAVTSLDNVTTAAEQNANQGQIVRNMMEEQFRNDELMPTVESAWGFEFEPGATEIDGLTFVGKDKDGNYQFQMGSNANRVVKMSEEQVISWGLRQGISLMQGQAANEQMLNDISADVQRMSDDADLMDEIDQLKQQNTRGVTTHDLWKQVVDVTSKFVAIDENGLYDEDNTSPNDAAVDLYARAEGNVAAAKENVAKAISALMSESEQGNLAAVGAFTGSALANQEARVQSEEATTRAAKQIAFLEQVDKVLDQMGARAKQLRENDAKEEAAKVSSTPVWQMEAGTEFPVDWNGTPAVAVVEGRDADGRNLVTVYDANDRDGLPLQAGIEVSAENDAEWEARRVRPQEQQPEPPMESAGNGTEQVQPEPQPQPEPTPQPTPTAAQPEPAPQQEQPQAEYPKDKQGKPQYDMIDDPNVFLQALVDEWGEDALGALDDIIEDTREGLEQKSKLEQRRINKRLSMLEAVRGMMQPQEETETPAEETTPVEEAPVEQPTAETQEKTDDEIMEEDQVLYDLFMGMTQEELAEYIRKTESIDKHAADYAKRIYSRFNLKDLNDFHDDTSTSGRTEVENDKYDDNNLTLPITIDGKPSNVVVETIIPTDIKEPAIQVASYEYNYYIDEETNEGWQEFGDLLEGYNAKAKDEDKGREDGDNPSIHFSSVDAAVKFSDFVNDWYSKKNTVETPEQAPEQPQQEKKPKKKSEKAKKTEKADEAKPAFKVGDEVMYKERKVKIIDVNKDGTLDLEYNPMGVLPVTVVGVKPNEVSAIEQTEAQPEQPKAEQLNESKWKYELKIGKDGHTTIERYTPIEGGAPVYDARWKFETDTPVDMLELIMNLQNHGVPLDPFKNIIEVLRTYGEPAKKPTEVAPDEKTEKPTNENTIFTEDEYERRKAALKHRHRTELNIAINPQDMSDLLYMAGYHIERGVRKFADFCKNMIEDLGDWVRPYLQTVYLGAKADDDIKKLGIDRKEWSSEDEVLDFDVENFDRTDRTEGTDNEVAHQYTEKQKKAFSEAVTVDMRLALERGEKPYRSINDIRKRAESVGMEVDKEGRDDILLQELVEDGLVRAARQVIESGRFGGAKSKEAFDAICKLYEMQPTISMRSSNRVKMQQYSTPLPMAFVADMFAYKGGKVLEPTAGNGMLVFAIPSKNVTVNELDETRLANLHEQGFPMVLNEDALTVRFVGKYDSVIANPPFGSSPAKDYDGKMISGLDEQITLNALSAMKDDGRAAIIIGGNMEYGKNGGVAGNRAFWTYLYDHYNVKGVVDMEGKLYGRQGTTYPTRMILIDGRRSEEERAQTAVYPPIKEKAVRKAESFDDLYDIVTELLSLPNKTNGNEVLRDKPPVSDNNGTQGQTGVQRRGEESDENDSDVGGRDGRGNGVERTRPNAQGEVRPTKGDSGSVDVGSRPSGLHGAQSPQYRTEREPVVPDSGTAERPGRGANDGGSTESKPNGEAGRVSDGGVQDVGTPVQRVGLTKPKEQEKRTLTEEKLPYRQHNSAFSLESVAPAAMVEAMDKALAEIEKTYGKSIDEFVTDELGYDSVEDMHNALAAEQVDSVAMAIHQMKQGQAMIIGDQTGVGKGRQMAALIRWAVRQGKKPIFVTQKAFLFSDIYRDLVDVGSGELRPFIFNSYINPKKDEYGNEIHDDKSGEMLDADGNLVYRAPTDAKQKKIFESGELPDEYDFAVLTYSQVNTGDAQSREEARKAAKEKGERTGKKEENPKPSPKADFLRKIANDNYMFLDESHTAAGDSKSGAYLQSLLRDAKAATFASATFAKRPDTMPLYAVRTAMSKANVKQDELIGIIKKGGVTLQEIMSRALTEAGQMVRRERDMSDVKTDWITIEDPKTVAKSRKDYDMTIAAFNAIIKFQNDYVKPMIAALSGQLAATASSADVKKGTDNAGIRNVPFASKTYNYTKQLMLALKVDAIVDKVVEEIEAGRHPVIALESTMEASIKEYMIGDVIEEPTFSGNLLRGLDAVMQYTIKDENGKDSHRRYTPKELGEEGERAYYELQDFIRESTKGIFISPLDAIISKLNEKGYKVGELTGRNVYVDTDEQGRFVLKKRTDKDKKRMMREFNSGALDVLILNKSASTGISLHASNKFSDQRQRTMVIAQPLSDINDYMQMIGRIDRTGQVHRGYYINLGLPVPAENRFLMMLSTKLKSLNANTTTSQESESNSVEAPDLLNKYGSKVVVEYLRDNPEIYVKMGEPISKGMGQKVSVKELDDYEAPENDDVIRTITGYVALLSTKEQDEFYNDVVQRYNDLIKYLDDTGTNDLKITVMPLKAKTLEKKVSSKGVDPNGSNPFAKDAYVETVEMDVLRKPMKADDVRKTIEQLNTPKGTEHGHLATAAKEKSVGDRVMEIIGTVQREAQEKLQAENERYEEAKKKAVEDIEKQRAKINKQQKRTEEEKAEAIEKFITDTNAKVEEQHQRNVMKIEALSELLEDKLTWFKVGGSYLMPDVLESESLASPELASPAIFCGYKAKDSKITSSTTFAVFATLDGRRRIEVKLSDNAAAAIGRLTSDNYDIAQEVTLDNWDSKIPTNTRKTGYIMTGNILQAVKDTQDPNGNYPGQLVSYTDEEGNVHDGILMPDKWKPGMMKNSGKPINAVMSKILNGELVKSTDGKVSIYGSGWAKTYTLTVPKTKKEGGVYFENPVILKSVSSRGFWQNRGEFRADINGEDNLRAVVNELAKLGVRVSDEQQGDGEVMYRDQEREYAAGEILPITKGNDGYRVEGLNDSYPNVDRLLDAWRDAHPDYFAEIRDGKLYVEPWNLGEGRTAKERRHNQATAERQWRRAHERANDTINKLGLQDRVTILDSTEGLTGKRKKAKGWFDTKTGKIVIVMPNHNSPRDVVKTILHEGVAHYGLRQLVGEKNMNEFLDRVFEAADKEVRGRIIDLAMNKYDRNFRKATEEYLAGLAEDTNFDNPTFLEKVKALLVKLLDKMGIQLGDGLTDNELRYILWKSYRNLVADAESLTEVARDAAMQSALEVGNFAPAVAAESRAMESPENGTEQIYSKNFKRWFGDWENEPENASKVVDEDGKPLVVYHGRSEQFSTFERRKGVRFVMGLEDEVESEGFFFTPDRDFAEQYAANAERRRGGNRNTIACYLNIRRPLDLTSDNFAQLYEEVTGYEYQLGMDDITNLWEIMDIEGMADKIKSKGYDGVIFAEERADDGTVTEYSYCVFDPNQIKSATDNNGGFDPDNDDILFRDAEPANKIAGEYNRMTGANVDWVSDKVRIKEELLRSFFDGLRPLEQMEKLIAKTLKRELRDSEKAYELATQTSSVSADMLEREETERLTPMIDKFTNMVKWLMDEHGLSREEAQEKANNYMLAKHGLERNAWFEKQGKDEGDYAGLTGLAESIGENPDDYKAVAENIVSEFERMVGNEKVNEFWDSVNDFTNRMLEISYDSGMIDKDTFEDLQKRHKYYIPLRGFADGTASDLFDYITKAPQFQDIFKKAKGRKSKADDPLSNLYNMMQSAIVIGNQNKVMQKIYNLAVNSKSDLLRITKPWYVYNDAMNIWEEKFPDIPGDATADETDAIVKQFEADMAQLKANGKAKRKLNRLDVGKRMLNREKAEHRMIAYIDGQRVAMFVNGNPLVAQALNRANTNQLGVFAEKMQGVTRIVSMINTSLSPAFMLTNSARDIGFALFSAMVTGGFKKTGQMAAWMATSGWVIPRLIATGKLDAGLVNKIGKQNADQIAQWWQEFTQNGGETGFMKTLSAEKARAQVNDMITHMLNGSKDGKNRLKKATFDVVTTAGRYSEDISRFAAYCWSRSQGNSVMESVNEAKNVTVNFNVKGGGNSTIARVVAGCRACYSFFNAALQGINRMARLAKEHPKAFATCLMACVLQGFLLPWLNMLMFTLLGGDDDDWEKYKTLTEYTANHNLVLYVGDLNPFKKTKGKFIKIPYSQELAPFAAMGNIFFRQQMGWNNGRSVADQIASMFLDLSPVSVGESKSFFGKSLKTVTPTLLKPIAELGLNEDFTASPIYQKNQWNKYDAGWEKAYENKTSRWLVDGTRWLEQNTNGWVDINPAAVEHLFSGMLGGIGRSGDKLVRFVSNGFQLQDAPFIRTMMFDSNPKGYIGAVQREYGRNAYEVLPEMKAKVEKADALEFARLVNTKEYQIANMVSIYKTGKDLAGNKMGNMGIDKMEKEYKKLAGMSDGSEEYREQLEAVRADITEAKMQMLDEIQQVIYEHSGEVTLDNMFGLRKPTMDYVRGIEERSKAKAK